MRTCCCSSSLKSRDAMPCHATCSQSVLKVSTLLFVESIFETQRGGNKEARRERLISSSSCICVRVRVHCIHVSGEDEEVEEEDEHYLITHARVLYCGLVVDNGTTVLHTSRRCSRADNDNVFGSLLCTTIDEKCWLIIRSKKEKITELKEIQ